MKNVTMVSALAAVLLMGCGTVKKVGKATTSLVGGKKPVPESIWNAERTWSKTGVNPPTYVPYGFEGETDPSRGEWLQDERDGKRLFVPAGGVEGVPEGVLRAEAWKATRE